MADFVRGPFPEADSAWLPTLGDILWKRSQGDTYYEICGFDKLVISDGCPHVTARMTTLTERFNERYFNRRIGSETLERWQVRLQNRMDEIATRYEFAYTAYERYADTLLEDMPFSKIINETFNENEDTTVDDTAGGSDTTAAKQRDIDTPDSIINASDDYADSLRDGSTTTNYGRTDHSTGNRGLDHTLDRKEQLGGSELARSIHDAMDAYRDLDTRLIAEFENLFLNMFWY